MNLLLNNNTNPIVVPLSGVIVVPVATVIDVPAASDDDGFVFIESIGWLLYSDGVKWRKVMPARSNFPTPVALFDRYLATALEQGYTHVWPLSGGYATPTMQFDYGTAFDTDHLAISYITGSVRGAPGIYPAAESGSVPIDGSSWFQIEGSGAFPTTDFSWSWWLQPNSFGGAGFNNLGFGGGGVTMLVCNNGDGDVTLRLSGVEVIASDPTAVGSSNLIGLTRGAGSPGLYSLYLNGALVGTHSGAAPTGSGWFINTASADAQYQSFCSRSGVMTLEEHQALYAAGQTAP